MPGDESEECLATSRKLVIAVHILRFILYPLQLVKKGKERRETLAESWDLSLCPCQQHLCLPVYQSKAIRKDDVKVITSAFFEAKITTG